jgi:hypothetical protein
LRDDLGEAGQARHGREAGFLAEEGGHLEIWVQPRLEPSIRLEEEVIPEDHGRIRLVRAEIAFRTDSIGRQFLERRRRPADEHAGGRRGRIVSVREPGPALRTGSPVRARL